MAISWVQTIGGNGLSGTTATLLITVSAGSIILITVLDLTAAGRTISVSDAQGAYTLVTPPGNVSSASETSATLYLANANAGLHTLTISATAADNLYFAATEYSGVATASPVFASAGQYQTSPGTGAGAITSGTYNSGSGNTVVGGCLDDGNVDAGMSASSGTLRFNGAISSSFQFTLEDQASIGAGDASKFTSTNGAARAKFTTSIALAPLASNNATIAWMHI